MNRNLFLILILVFWVIQTAAQGESNIENSQYTIIGKPVIALAEGQAPNQSQVEVAITINQEGTVISAAASNGHPLLRAASIQAARKSRFTPTRNNGTATQAKGFIIYNFEYFEVKSFAIVLCVPQKQCIAKQNAQRGTFDVIFAGIINGSAQKLEAPQIPIKILEKLRHDETVYVRVLVELHSGKVVSAQAVSGDVSLHQFAVEAVLKSRFSATNDMNTKLLVSALIVYRVARK